MSHDHLFVSIPGPRGGEMHRREAVRIRALAANATTPTMRQHLEDRARTHEWLAGDHEKAG
jgi:hypothetical protein